MKIKKILLWSILLIITHVIFFVGGSMRGRQIALNYLDKEFEISNFQVTLAHYSEYRDIALNIEAAKYSRAKCKAELMASALLDDLRDCLKDESCKNSLTKKAREFAPEILGDRPFPIERRTNCP